MKVDQVILGQPFCIGRSVGLATIHLVFRRISQKHTFAPRWKFHFDRSDFLSPARSVSYVFNGHTALVPLAIHADLNSTERMVKRKKRNSQPDYQALEPRNLLAVVVSLDSGNQELSITGDSSNNNVTVSIVNGDTVRVNADGVLHQFIASSVGQINFTGGNGNDFLTNSTAINLRAFGNSGDDTITSGNGNDYIHAGPGVDHVSSSGGNNTLIGHSGNDTLIGGTGIDLIFGGDGNDEISGNEGNDRLSGGRDNDTIEGGDGSDTLFGLTGDDTLRGGDGNDFLYGQAGVDLLYGGNGIDRMRGGSGNDTVLGEAGRDRLGGDTGDDLLRGGLDDDLIFGWDGVDTIYGDEGVDFIYGGNDDDQIYGGDGNDVVRGGSGIDEISGNAGNDRLAGDDGNDQIDGGTGVDRIFGDLGNDVITGEDTDTVTGGQGNDQINLGSGANDFAVFSGNFADYELTESNGNLVVTDLVGTDGADTLSMVETLRFADGNQDAEIPSPFDMVVTVQPIIVSNNNGSNTAEYFGSQAELEIIMDLIDEIYLQASIDVHWLTPNTWNNTFANVGDNPAGSRPQNDLGDVVTSGDNAGVGNTDPLILDMYFVEISAGFSNQSENVANGLAYVGFNGSTVHVGDNLVGFQGGREVVARVVAHELAHNLGLGHVHEHDNLMDDGDQLNQSQIQTIRDSQYSVPV